MKQYLVIGIILALSACKSINPPIDTTTHNKIKQELKLATIPKEKPATQPIPQSVSHSLLPPIKMRVPKTSAKQLEQRFNLVVNGAPINEVLLGIVSGTRYSMLVHPKVVLPSRVLAAGAGVQATPTVAELTDKVSVNLKDVTVFEALDTIREMYGYEYKVDGTRIFVQPPSLQIKVFQVNYIPGMRRGVSDLQVIGGASGGSSGSSSGGGGGNTSGGTGGGGSSSSGGSSGSYASIQATGLTSSSKADVWGEVEDTLRTVLGCQIPKKQGEISGKVSSSGNASRADVTSLGDTTSEERVRGVDGCTDGRSLNINQMSGIILVRGMPSELRFIEGMLHSMQLNIERQVMIEAKIIDVTLNSESQQGINWAGFQHNLHRFSVGADTSSINGSTSNGGAVKATTTLGQLLGTGLVGTASAPFAAGLGIALQIRNFSALINFLQTQGEVNVLSSPRISTLNNQKAVLKVGSEESFVTSITAPLTSTASNNGINPTVAQASLVYQPFFSGISLDVTPQIDDADNITLHVHPMVNTITEKSKIAQPTSDSQVVPFAVNTISETDSVVKTKDGQVIVIGGLMTESAQDIRSKVPGAGDAPAVGALFRKGAQRLVKRELVILLKPTIVKDESIWTDDIAAMQQRVEDMNTQPQAQRGN